MSSGFGDLCARGVITATFLGLALVPARSAAQSSTLSGISRGYGGGFSSIAGPVDVATASSSGVSFTDGVLVAPSGSLFAGLATPSASASSAQAAQSAQAALTAGEGVGAPSTTLQHAAPEAARAAEGAARSPGPQGGGLNVVVAAGGGGSEPQGALVLNGKVNLDGGQP